MKDIYQPSAPDQRAAYQVKVWGRLSADWSEWLNGVTITPEDDATITCIPHFVEGVANRPALHD